MLQITKLEVQKNNKNKYNLYLNDEFYCGVFIETAIKLGLKENKIVEENVLKKAVFESEKQMALNRCANLLSRSFKTESQIKKYLKEKQFSDDVIFEVLNKLKEYNYVNDENYVDLFIKTNQNKLGKQKIKSKLMLVGVNKELIENKLENFESEENVILQIANKFLKNKELNLKTKNNLIRHLIYKGFGFDEIKPILNNIFKGE